MFINNTKNNLINKENNEELYYTRLSDEFVRYNKFRNFIFENSNVYSYGSVEYNIINNELLLFQSSLTQDFLKTYHLQIKIIIILLQMIHLIH